MRILPVALRYADGPIEEMLCLAHRISSLTHRHPRSQMACGLYCCMARGLLHEMTPMDAYRFMIEIGQRYYQRAPYESEYAHFSRIFRGNLADLPEEAIASSGYVVHTLEAAIWCLLTSNSFADAVLKAVNLGDDTDTTGCVTGGLAGITFGINAISRQWRDDIVGKDQIHKLLMEFAEK
jgi:ADP-ribosylglycohydrolase